MRTKTRIRTASTVAGLLLVIPALAVAQQDPGSPQAIAVDTDADLPGMALFTAHPLQPAGMDEAEVKKTLKLMGHPLDKMDRAQFLWDYGFTFMTPRHTVSTGDFLLGKFEVTNAQWKVFLDSELNQGEWTTLPDLTLQDVVRALWGYDAESNPVDAQRAGLHLFARNGDALAKALNPDGDESWEPLRAWVENSAVPAGIALRFNIILPPSYWKDGELPDAEQDRPARGVSWADARKFCRWAGFHLPREAEWTRAARGENARLFPWGNEWNEEAAVFKDWPHFAGEPTPQPVNSVDVGMTQEGLHHMVGNVNEYVFDFAKKYPGSKTKFKYHNAGFLARGGSFKDEPYVMMAADRVWDMGSTQIGAESRAETFGFRAAAYPLAGADLTLELATYAAEFNRISGAANWLPYPIGVSEKEAQKREKREIFQGFAHMRTAGWMERQVDANASHFTYVKGPAKGIALLPIKGVSDKFMKNKNALIKWSLMEEGTAFVGALVTTDDCTITLQNEAGEPVKFDMGDINSNAWVDHDLAFTYQIGLWLVLKGDKVAVYGGNAEGHGIHGRHLRAAPLGYLPENWEVNWAITSEAAPTGKYENGVATLSAPLPQLTKDGTPKRGGKSSQLTIKVPATFK